MTSAYLFHEPIMKDDVMEYSYPAYGIDLPVAVMQECCAIATRLLGEVGFLAPHDRFLSMIRNKPGIRIEGQRVYFHEDLTRKYMDAFLSDKIAPNSGWHLEQQALAQETTWRMNTAGYSMAVRDIESDEVRPATCRDLRDMIRLADSLGIGGSYPCMPQDVPPLLRAVACFKICWETSDKVRPYDYQQPEQVPYIYEMSRLMGRPFVISLCVPTNMTLDPSGLDVFLDLYPKFKANRDIEFSVLSYGMIGITKPVSVPGCATMILAEKLAVHMLMNLFDPEVRTPVNTYGGTPTDLRHACWAFGSPRRHLFEYLNTLIGPRLRGRDLAAYRVNAVHLETSSPAIDEQAALEKMAVGLTGAMHGARTFNYLGTLCVDDLYSGVQLVIDVEIVNYIRETIEAYNPAPDVLDMEGLYEECRDVCLGRDDFISHPHTVAHFRNIVPSSDRIVREKLRSWMTHQRQLKDRARDEAVERLRTHQSAFRLPSDKQKELDRIFGEAVRRLT